MTGKNPGKHGIFHFLEARPGTYELSYLNGAPRRGKTIRRMLSMIIGLAIAALLQGLAVVIDAQFQRDSSVYFFQGFL